MGRIHGAFLLSIFILLVFHLTFSSASAHDTIHIAAILDVTTPAGKAANMSLHFALQDVNHKAADGTRLKLTIRESRGFVGNVLQMFRSEFAAILVQDSTISKFLAPVAEEVHVPILSFGRFGIVSGSKYLLPTIQIRYDEMKGIAVITDYFHWKSVSVVYEDDESWLSGVYALSEALKEFQEESGNNRTTISRTTALSSGSSQEQIRETLVELNNTSGVRAFIVHTSVHLALNMFAMAHELGMINETYVWLVTDSVASSLDSLPPPSIQTLQGIVGVKSVSTPQFTELVQRLQINSSDDAINRIGAEAYSSLKLIASAVFALRSQDIKIGYGGQIPENDTNSSTSMMVLTGGDLLLREIVQAISGPVTDSLEIREYEIINVVGKSHKTVGFWRNDTGRLQSARREENKLGAIIWPGDTTQVPNGYRKLVIGKVIQNNASDYIDFIGRLSGYTNDTFQAAVDTLPYNLPYVYEAFDKGNSNLSDYDSFVTELYGGNRYDAVVGDATILWNRSLYVGFTQPYTQTGLVMMVPLKRVRVFTWSFLHPFTAALWATAGAFFVCTAFLVWLVEHKDNEEFQGGVTKQVVTSLTSSLSAFVFAQREDVKSCLGKGIVAICLFSAIILNNSYTAHLASILTVERLAPTITNMKSLTTNNVRVGYLSTSFVKTYLTDDLKIHKDRLVPLESPHDYVLKLLSGDVGAIVDESPYLEIVKSLYPCEKLAIVDRGYLSSGGFGFCFREGSPFLSDISEAVLNISEHHQTVESIHGKWFGERTSSPDLETVLDSNASRITLTNLRNLFTLTASIYAIAVLIHICRKIHQKSQDLMASWTYEFSTHIPAMISLQTIRVPASIETQR
ncbi:glutamate receptor 3.4-like [Cryptomeria japonica]|uniref:glutamate receptor 3.4-like n=1 Tax=Cryptomeria japonica TaxID=3369 RepID=UPI0025ABBD3B|nr:glutamate receptor 3.4-like [Cryptomeria japonica]